MRNLLLFISRHYPTYGQIELVKRLGFDGIKLERIVFPDTKEGLNFIVDKFQLGSIIALAAPTWVHHTFWERGFDTLEFVPYGYDNEVKVDPQFSNYYFCKGAYIFEFDGEWITARYIECPISIEEQIKKGFGSNFLEKGGTGGKEEGKKGQEEG